MKKKTSIMLFILVCILTSSIASAADLSGCFGVGYDVSLQCISVRYFIWNFGIDVMAGVSVEPITSALGDQQTKLDLRSALYVLYALEAFERANLNVFIEGEIEYIGSHTKNQGELNFYARAGLSPEIFVLENISIEAYFGFELAAINNLLPNVYRISFDLYGQGINIVSGLSFHWYFGKGKENTADNTD